METDIKEFRGLCEAIGFAVVNWSLAEQMLDGCVSIVYHDFNGRTLAPNGIPRSFDNKAEYMKRALKKIAALAPFKDEGIAIISRMKILSHERHDLAHGVIQNLEPVDGKFQMLRLDYGEHVHTIRNVAIDDVKTAKFLKELLDLGGDVGDFSLRLENAVEARSKLP